MYIRNSLSHRSTNSKLSTNKRQTIVLHQKFYLNTCTTFNMVQLGTINLRKFSKIATLPTSSQLLTIISQSFTTNQKIFFSKKRPSELNFNQLDLDWTLRYYPWQPMLSLTNNRRTTIFTTISADKQKILLREVKVTISQHL